jgi:hypothetical protein
MKTIAHFPAAQRNLAVGGGITPPRDGLGLATRQLMIRKTLAIVAWLAFCGMAVAWGLLTR